MQHITKVFMGVACSLFMIGCVADDGAPGSAAGDDDDQPATVEQAAAERDASPTPSSTGFFTTTTACKGISAWQSPATGNSHAGIRSCSILWSADTTISPTDYNQTVHFEVEDQETDGVCADVTVTGSSSTFTECTGQWKTYNVGLSGHHSSIAVTLSWGGNDPNSRTTTAPSGF